MGFKLLRGRVVYSDDEALDTVREYAFATDLVTADARFPEAFEPHEVPRYAYRTYDCVPASEGPEFNDLDLFVGAGLNADLDVATITRLRSFADRAAMHLHRAHQLQPDFLHMSRVELGDDPPTDSAGWHLQEAWRQGMATPRLKVARVHKTLHHKRPRLVPLLDNETSAPIAVASAMSGADGIWQQIYDEVHAHAAQFQQLADEFDKLAAEKGGVSLSRLRLYDILVWMRVTNRR